MEEMTKIIGADSLGFLDKDHLNLLIGAAPYEGYCYGCFCGEYPTDAPIESEICKFDKKIGN